MISYIGLEALIISFRFVSFCMQEIMKQLSNKPISQFLDKTIQTLK